jgi:hypothetical protein
LSKSETNFIFDVVRRLAPIRSLPTTSRRTLLGGLGATMALPLLPAITLLESASTVTAEAETTPQSVPIRPQPVPTAVQTVATAQISTTATSVLPNYFMGLSYEKGDFVTELLFTGSNLQLAGLFNRLGNGVLRIGGNSVDTTVWNTNGEGNTAGQVAPADIENLAQFMALTNWKLLYALNLATSTPALAAAEAAYVQSVLGNVLLGFEIGNEPDEYGLSYFPTGWNLTAFETLWEQFRSAIVEAVPTAVITGPATAGNITTWTAPFVMGPNGGQIAVLTQHYYRGNGHSVNATVANLVSADNTIVADCVALKSSVAGVKIPFRFAETNSYLYGGSPGVSNAYASALWAIDHLFHIAYGGGSGVNMQGGDDAYYTPIENDNSVIVQAQPEYYGLLFFSLAGQGELLPTKFSVANFNATIYAVRTATGGLNIVMVNKEVFQSLKITIDCNQQVNAADLIELQGSSLSATSGQTIQGYSVTVDGSFIPGPTSGLPYAPENISSSWVTCYVPAISAVLLRVS